MTSPPKPLPEWPVCDAENCDDMEAFYKYAHARAEYYRARLEMAVDLLTRMSGMVHSVHQDDIDATLSLIGELPEDGA